MWQLCKSNTTFPTQKTIVYCLKKKKRVQFRYVHFNACTLCLPAPPNNPT